MKNRRGAWSVVPDDDEGMFVESSWAGCVQVGRAERGENKQSRAGEASPAQAGQLGLQLVPLDAVP